MGSHVALDLHISVILGTTWEAYIGRNESLIRVWAALFGIQISILRVRTKHFDNRMVQPLFVLLEIEFSFLAQAEVSSHHLPLLRLFNLQLLSGLGTDLRDDILTFFLMVIK